MERRPNTKMQLGGDDYLVRDPRLLSKSERLRLMKKSLENMEDRAKHILTDPEVVELYRKAYRMTVQEIRKLEKEIILEDEGV